MSKPIDPIFDIPEYQCEKCKTSFKAKDIYDLYCKSGETLEVNEGEKQHYDRWVVCPSCNTDIPLPILRKG